MNIWEKICNIFSVLGCMLTVLILFYFLPSLPQEIPIHFDISGKADVYGTKILLLIFCLLSCFLTFILSNIEHFPILINYPFAITERNHLIQTKLFHKFLIFLKLETVYLFLYIEVKTILIAFTFTLTASLGNVFLFFLLILLLSFFIYLHKAYQNR